MFLQTSHFRCLEQHSESYPWGVQSGESSCVNTAAHALQQEVAYLKFYKEKCLQGMLGCALD